MGDPQKSTPTANLAVIQASNGKWRVIQGSETIAEFPTHGAAWRWLDRHERRLLWASRETSDWKGYGAYHLA